jgi:hypothetical protein
MACRDASARLYQSASRGLPPPCCTWWHSRYLPLIVQAPSPSRAGPTNNGVRSEFGLFRRARCPLPPTTATVGAPAHPSPHARPVLCALSGGSLGWRGVDASAALDQWTAGGWAGQASIRQGATGCVCGRQSIGRSVGGVMCSQLAEVQPYFARRHRRDWMRACEGGRGRARRAPFRPWLSGQANQTGQGGRLAAQAASRTAGAWAIWGPDVFHR